MRNPSEKYPYTLPVIDFVGGSNQDLSFHVFRHELTNPFDLTGCTADFSIVDYLDKDGTPILSKSMTISATGSTTSAGTTRNVLTVTLTSRETVNLAGKYIYQISIRNSAGKTEIPHQGILYIISNIHRSFITA